MSALKGFSNPTVNSDRQRYADQFRRPDYRKPREDDRRDYDGGRRRGYDDGRGRAYDGGYHSGYHRGYKRGYHRGYHYGYRTGRYYRHYHYYGPHRVFGFHYGGFGFYHGHWHFAIVIGSPLLVHRHYYHYDYSWWDGRGATLVTWDRAVQHYPANYNFAAGSCVELWLKTTDGTEYAIKIDPRYYGAKDPGDLYAALWAELEQQGQLQIEDVSGAVHIFPAGMVQQLEARACS